ncbi:hypothetical protein K1719_022044 [Acacia pycnantha]|nr:hypothetical protein K1719_022044 [Acacia pycnantha]
MAGDQLVRVNEDTRLNHRALDIRTPANQAIFRIRSQVEKLFRIFLWSEGFVEIHTPKLIAGSSEGGAAVFTLDYMGQPACLAQSPQLQMTICGLDVEMEIKNHYFEIMDIVDRLFGAMFDSVNEECQKDLEAVGSQVPRQRIRTTLFPRDPSRLVP